MEEKYFSVIELSKLIKRSPKGVRDLAFRKKIPYRKAAGRLIFIKNEIETWIDQSDGLSFEQWQQAHKQK